MEDRLTELEIKAALSEDLLDELNRSFFRQQQQIDQLQQALRSLRQQVQSSLPAEDGQPKDEIPPHY